MLGFHQIVGNDYKLTYQVLQQNLKKENIYFPVKDSYDYIFINAINRYPKNGFNAIIQSPDKVIDL